MNAGCTAIVTLTKPENRPLGARPSDEQLHVLPHYIVDKAEKGPGLDVLDHYTVPSRLWKESVKERAKRTEHGSKEQGGFLQFDGTADNTANDTPDIGEQHRIRNMAGADFFRKMQEEFARRKEAEMAEKQDFPGFQGRMLLSKINGFEAYN